MPFSRDVDISVSIPAGDRASVFVFNVSGEKIRTLGANEPPGERVFHWDGKLEDGRRAVGGVYFLKVVTDRESVAKTLVLVK